MELNAVQKRIWSAVQERLADEQVASPDHVQRMTTWCQKLARDREMDIEALTAGALVHDVGVTVDRKTHYTAGLNLAQDILAQSGLEQEKIQPALHVMETHSRYGGPEPKTPEAQIAQDADALEYIGAVGILRAVIRGLNDKTFDGNINNFPEYLNSLLNRVSSSLHTQKSEDYAKTRIEFMESFLEQLKKEINFEV
ncbi:MAG: HD domain-containing protein [Desulfovermiculus sp.]|nr:HD domain-containing protein [Desulfovermiculus sp.]